MTQVQLDDVKRRAEVAGDDDVLEAVSELERLRTPTGAPGRAGYDAYGDARGWRVFSGAPMPTWEQQLEKTPDVAAAWVRAGQAERAVAYALAVGCAAPTDADSIRKLAQAPATAADRMARVAVLLREASALLGEVVADADAPAELRAAASSIRSGMVGSGADGEEDVAALLDKVRQRYGQESERQKGLRELTQASEETGDYFGGPVVPVREGDVWVDQSGIEWTASKPGATTNVFTRTTEATLVLADHPSTHGWRRKGSGA